jgi:hypothetical protein
LWRFHWKAVWIWHILSFRLHGTIILWLLAIKRKKTEAESDTSKKSEPTTTLSTTVTPASNVISTVSKRIRRVVDKEAEPDSSDTKDLSKEAAKYHASDARAAAASTSDVDAAITSPQAEMKPQSLKKKLQKSPKSLNSNLATISVDLKISLIVIPQAPAPESTDAP